MTLEEFYEGAKQGRYKIGQNYNFDAGGSMTKIMFGMKPFELNGKMYEIKSGVGWVRIEESRQQETADNSESKYDPENRSMNPHWVNGVFYEDIWDAIQAEKALKKQRKEENAKKNKKWRILWNIIIVAGLAIAIWWIAVR